MGLKYKIDINWKDIGKGLPYKPENSAANDLADIFVTASTTLAEEVTQDFANDNTRVNFTLTIKPPAPKLEYYSTISVKSDEEFDEAKKQQLNQTLLKALASAQEKLAAQMSLDLEIFTDKNDQNNLQFRNISPMQRARFDVELNKQLPGIFNDVCNMLGYAFEMTRPKSPQHKITPFKMTPRPFPY